MDASSFCSSDGSSSSDEGKPATSKPQGDVCFDDEEQNHEDLVVRLRLRLAASHLPKALGKRFSLSRKDPDTYATVTSIIQKVGNKHRTSNICKTRDTQADLAALSSAGCATDTDADGYMVEWGSTEVIRSCRSPQWVEAIPLKYEYGSSLYVYVRVMQADSFQQFAVRGDELSMSFTKETSNDSLSSFHNGNENGGYYNEKGQPVTTPSPKTKDRMGYCFGTALFEISEVLASRNLTKVKRLKTSGGCVYARVEPMNEEKVRVRFQFQAYNLVVNQNRMNKRLGLASSDPDTFLEIARPHDSPSVHSWITVFRSQPVFGSTSPCWDLAEIDLDSCCRDGDRSQPVRLSVYRQRKGRMCKLVGLCETTLDMILLNVCQDEPNIKEEAVGEKDFLLQRSLHRLQQVGRLRVRAAALVSLSGRIVNSNAMATSSPKKIVRVESNDSTVLLVGDPFNVDLRQLSVRWSTAQAPSATPQVTLSDFIDSGGQLEFCVAIDFTSSNGNPRTQGTLHFQSDDVLNDYEETITCIGNAIDKYSSSSDCCVWGFGAKFGDGVVRHLFQCGANPTVEGVNGILDAYRSMFQGGITMSGPTVFTKAIQAAAVRARNYKLSDANCNQRYCVLLVITDGIMDNFDETREKLAVYSEVPLSIIFVGVGRADFSIMHALCDRRLMKGSLPLRRNTTFVEFRQHQDDPRSLVQAALGDLPKHISEYFSQAGISLASSG